MVDRFGNVFNNLNQVYMAGLMAVPMILIELGVMRSMFREPKLNAAIVAASVVVMVASWFAIREQGAIHETQSLRSMIPHHAGAILMCEEARLTDPAARDLCDRMIQSQLAEIEEMKAHLASVGE